MVLSSDEYSVGDFLVQTKIYLPLDISPFPILTLLQTLEDLSPETKFLEGPQVLF